MAFRVVRNTADGVPPVRSGDRGRVSGDREGLSARSGRGRADPLPVWTRAPGGNARTSSPATGRHRTWNPRCAPTAAGTSADWQRPPATCHYVQALLLRFRALSQPELVSGLAGQPLSPLGLAPAAQPTRPAGAFVRSSKFATLVFEHMGKGDVVGTPGEPEDVEEQFPGWHAWNVQTVPETRRPASYICNEGFRHDPPARGGQLYLHPRYEAGPRLGLEAPRAPGELGPFLCDLGSPCCESRAGPLLASRGDLSVIRTRRQAGE